MTRQHLFHLFGSSKIPYSHSPISENVSAANITTSFALILIHFRRACPHHRHFQISNAFPPSFHAFRNLAESWPDNNVRRPFIQTSQSTTQLTLSQTTIPTSPHYLGRRSHSLCHALWNDNFCKTPTLSIEWPTVTIFSHSWFLYAPIFFLCPAHCSNIFYPLQFCFT